MSILLKSIEEFSVDMIQNKNIESCGYENKTKIILDNNLNIYDILWLYLSFLIKNPSAKLYPRTPLGKILLFIFYIIGSFFLCIIYYTLNNIMQLNRSSQAYSKFQKLFQPENKENKASDDILAIILLKKYNNLYGVKEMKETFVNQDNINKKRKTIFDYEIDKLRQKNALILRSKKIFFV